MNILDIEYRKGILFVRIKGSISRKKDLRELNDLIEKIGIKYLVINTNNIKYYDIKSINNIKNYNKKVLKEKKTLLICDKNTNRNKVFNTIPSIKSEIEAFSLI